MAGPQTTVRNLKRTREKILASAKTLFSEKGYEGATIRDIAAAAGMSTGAVFASFTDKSDLFNDIISADREAPLAVAEAEYLTHPSGRIRFPPTTPSLR